HGMRRCQFIAGAAALPPRNRPDGETASPRCLSLTAEWEVPAPSFGQVTRFWHIKFRNAFSFNKYVSFFVFVTLRSQQFVINPWCVGSWSRKCACNFSTF